MTKKHYQYLGFAFIVIIMNYVVSNFSSFHTALNTAFAIIKPIFVGMIIAYFVYPIVVIVNKKVFNFIKSKKVSYYLSILVSYIIIFFLIYSLYIWLKPIALDGINIISKIDYKEFYLNLDKSWTSFSSQYTLLENIKMVEIIQNTAEAFTSSFSSGNIINVASGLAGLTSSLYTYIMAIIVSIYMIISKKELIHSSDRFFSVILNYNLYLHVKKYFLYFEEKFRKFFFGKMLDSLIIGILALIGLYFLKVPFFPILAIIVMVTNMIPYFGPFIGGIPVVLVTLFVTQDPMHTLWSGLFILALQQFDGIYLGPKILGDSVGVSSVWVIISIIIGGAMFKVVGLFICIPVSATLKYMFDDFYTYRVSVREKDKVRLAK